MTQSLIVQIFMSKTTLSRGRDTGGKAISFWAGLVTWLTMVSASSADEATVLDHVLVEGQLLPGNGLISAQDGAQTSSVITRSAIEQKSPLNNAYQAMDLLPGVNTYSYDATGLFGGGLRMRGFNSDQIGVSIDGAPMNDAGNFAIYPSELIDLENLEEIDVQHGANAQDAPMVGATGGSIGLRTSNPQDVARFRVQQTYGAYDAYKTFLRADTGYLDDKRFKAFVSVSKAEANKWKGNGSADREHLDFKGVLNLTPGNSITGGLLYNELFNNNLRTLTLDDIKQYGMDADFGTLPPQHLAAVNGKAGKESVPKDGYYDLNLNPYRNYLATLQGRFELAPNLKLDVDPYYSYGYGTGGNELRTLTESGPSTGKFRGGIQDINGDHDTLDTVMVYSGAVTETERPGVTSRLHTQLANHHLMAGYWYEYAHHRRTQPAVRFDQAGNSADPWLDDASLFLRRQDGTPYQGRDFLTRNVSQSFFAQDDIDFLENRLRLSLGIRYTELQRDFYNAASDSFAADYRLKQTYARPLPNVGIRYRFDDRHQVFASRSENFKAPPDSVLYGLIKGGSVKNGQLTGYSLKSVNVNEEVATHWDLGYRYTMDQLMLSGTLFYVDYRDRIASATDPNNPGTNSNYNVGNSVTQGVELASAWRFLPTWSLYGSFSYTASRMEQDLAFTFKEQDASGKTIYPVRNLPTSGKQFPDVPAWLAGAVLQYRDGPWSANLSAKYTGDRYATLVNDESVSGYTLVGFDAGYRLPSTAWFIDPMIRVNVYNLLDERYLNLNAGSGSSFTTHAYGSNSSKPSYYIGAPRSFGVTLSTDF